MCNNTGDPQTPSDWKEQEKRVHSVISFLCLQKHNSVGAGAAVVTSEDDGIGLRHDCNDGLQDCMFIKSDQNIQLK